MDEYIKREAAIAYIREQSEECQKAFEELGGESGIYADAYNDLAEDFYRIPAVNVAPIEALERLRDELCAQDLITMEGLRKLNTLIGKYTIFGTLIGSAWRTTLAFPTQATQT